MQRFVGQASGCLSPAPLSDLCGRAPDVSKRITSEQCGDLIVEMIVPNALESIMNSIIYIVGLVVVVVAVAAFFGLA